MSQKVSKAHNKCVRRKTALFGAFYDTLVNVGHSVLVFAIFGVSGIFSQTQHALFMVYLLIFYIGLPKPYKTCTQEKKRHQKCL